MKSIPTRAAMLAIALPIVAHAQSFLEFNFNDFSQGQVSGGHSFAAAGVSGTFNMGGGNGAESWGGDMVSITRWFGAAATGGNTPVLSFTTSVPITLDSIEFVHSHNHNPGYPTNPSYQVRLQFDGGTGYSDLGLFTADGSSSGTLTIAGPGALAAGTYSLRWEGFNFAYGDTSGSEYFMLDNVKLSTAVVPEPSGYAACCSAVLLGVVVWRRSRI